MAIGTKRDIAAKLQHDIDFDRLAVEFLVAVRGKRSQTGFSRVLGYKSNIAYRWESRQCWPSAAGFFERARKIGLDERAGLARLLPARPEWLDDPELSTEQRLRAFLEELSGQTPRTHLARAIGVSRYTLSRWLSGTAHPSLPDFFRFVERTTRRLLDLLQHWVDPSELACLAERWQRIRRARAVATEHPWAHAVVRVLQLDSYADHAEGGSAWIAQRLGLLPEQVDVALEALELSGQVQRSGDRWIPEPVAGLGPEADATLARRTKLTWTQVACERMAGGGPGSYGYSLFEVSREDLRKLRELHLQYVRSMQHIIQRSKGTECVGLYCAQLCDLASEDNALADG